MRKIEGNSFLSTLLSRHYGETEKHAIRRAILEATYFIDPEIVAQTQLLPIVRARRLAPAAGERKNSIVNGVFVSDNFPPDYVFRAAMSDLRHQGSTWLCHIYGGGGEARDTYFYTNLANLCLMPSFLAKFADTDAGVVSLLKECAFTLFGFDPNREMSLRTIDGSLRNQIRTATPPKRRLFDELNKKRDAKFLLAKTAGFLFSPGGQINSMDPWVSQMMIRRRQAGPTGQTP